MIWPETAFAGFASRNAALHDKTVRDATSKNAALITGIPRFALTGASKFRDYA